MGLATGQATDVKLSNHQQPRTSSVGVTISPILQYCSRM